MTNGLRIAMTSTALAFMAGTASAQSSGGGWSSWWNNWFGNWWGGWSNPPNNQTLPQSAVPEIDASTGLLALAAIGAALLLTWEINRRRKNN